MNDLCTHLPRLFRIYCPALDEILGVPFPLLDDGFVRVMDYMGDDTAIVQAARVSYGAGTKTISSDRSLIRYLMRNRHTSPFEMCELKLQVRLPMDIWRQWIRHRTASVNEYSTRYSIAIDTAHRTAPNQWRMQSSDNKQGSGAQLDAEDGERFSQEETELQEHCRRVYNRRIKTGIAREQARKDLPLSTYTEVYWKIDLHNLLHFLELRMNTHSQLEIRQYAELIGREIVAKWVPLVWEAFNDYRLENLTFSRLERELVRLLVTGARDTAISLAINSGMIRQLEKGFRRSTEAIWFERKLKLLGLELTTEHNDNTETKTQT